MCKQMMLKHYTLDQDNLILEKISISTPLTELIIKFKSISTNILGRNFTNINFKFNMEKISTII